MSNWSNQYWSGEFTSTESRNPASSFFSKILDFIGLCSTVHRQAFTFLQGNISHKNTQERKFAFVVINTNTDTRTKNQVQGKITTVFKCPSTSHRFRHPGYVPRFFVFYSVFHRLERKHCTQSCIHRGGFLTAQKKSDKIETKTNKGYRSASSNVCSKYAGLTTTK
jgi:hypothetical protein